MRLLHTADLHLGKVLHEQSLLEDQSFILERIATELDEGGYDLFIVAGDVFDRSVPPPEAVLLWDDFLHRISGNNPQLEIVVISGNHDGAQRLGFASRFLDRHRIHLKTSPTTLDQPITLRFQQQEWDVFAVPFLPSGTLETVREDVGPAVLKTQRDLWREALVRLEAARRPGVPSLLVAHLFASGGAESDSERLFLGEAEQIPASWLAGWEYVALGHLHRPQEPAPGVRYSGSPLAYSFSEAEHQKAMLRWENGRVTPLALAPRRPLTRLTGTFEDFARSDAFAGFQGHWLELTLTDGALVPGAMERLRARFPGLLSLVQAPLRASTAVEPLAHRRTGDVASDALRFLRYAGLEPTSDVENLVSDVAKEALDAAP